MAAKYVCVPCRRVDSYPTDPCPVCRGPMTRQYYTWRAPKKNDNAAWKRIEAGDWLWEKPKPRASDKSVHWDGATKAWKTW